MRMLGAAWPFDWLCFSLRGLYIFLYPSKPHFCGFAGPLGQPLRFEPVVEFVNPMVAAGALLFYAETVTARTENVNFRFVASSF